MAIGTRIGPDGRPIDEGFFGLGNALASLPGTPILGGAPPYTSGYNPGGGTNVSNTPAPGSGQGIGTTTGGGGPPKIPGTGEIPWSGPGTEPPAGPGGGFQQPGSFGSAPVTTQTNPGLPPPASTAGTGGFWGDQNPWAQNVGASINDQPVSFASPGNPNPNYITPEAASKIGQTFGANVVSQNLNNMASPGSSAPSAPIYGLDFGRGDIQDAGMGAYQLQRGDRPEDVAARYKAGLNTVGWGGVAPTVSRADENGMWNYSSPISTNTPTPEQAAFFAPGPSQGADVYAANKAGTGNYGLSSGSGVDQQALMNWLRGQLGG